MSTFKKLLALTLALAMVLSVSAFAGYSADTYADADKINGDCKDAVELLYALDIMTGDGKNFNPEATVTREEMAKMIYVILNDGEDDKAVTYTGAKMFSDVPAGRWSEGYINYAAATKLVQGRPDGTFGPTDPVTTAEATKMLLTAIGYSAEARGYVGANWDKNVLSDAAILGLLDGYKANVNTYAPRQWVAVLMENALYAYTYATMYPSFTGLLTSGTNKDQDYPTMMEKYLDAHVVEGIMTSANGYKIDGTKTAGAGKVIVDGVEFKAAASIEDLGQEFKAIVINDAATAQGGKAVSLRNTGTSVVAEDEVKDVTYELTYSTANNAANNKYEFTVADLTGKLGLTNDDDEAIVNVLDVVDGNNTYEELTAAQLKTEIGKGAFRNDVVRAIDADDDGRIDYVIYTPVEYARIAKTGTSQKYGEYVKAKGIDGEYLEVEGGTNLYIDDCIICEDELVVNNFVKFTWNIDEGMYNVEVLPVEEAVEFESRKVAKNQYTLGGETYNIAANAFDMDLTTLGEDYDLVIDGDLLVYAVKTDDNYKSMDEVNAKLAVLIKSDVRNTDDENDKQVKLLTIDGETAWYAYDVAGAKSAAAKDANILKWSDIVENDIDDESNSEWDQLCIVHTNSDGEVYLEKLVDGKDLNLPTELVDLVDNDAAAALKVKDGVAKLNGDKLAADNKFFAQIDGEYCVVTVEDLTAGTYSEIAVQALINRSNYYDTVVGGYLIIDDADPTTSEGFLWILDIDEKEYAKSSTIYVLFNDEDATEAEIKVTNALADLVEEGCYYYEVTSGKYTLTNVWDRTDAVEVGADSEGTLWYGWKNSVELGDYDIFALKTVIYERTLVDEEWEWVATEVICEFVTADELTEIVAECVAADETNNYIYSVNEDAGEDALYVQIDVEMYANQY